jgi:hypothetical protein
MADFDDDDAWGNSFNVPINREDETIIKEAKERFRLCEEFESIARANFDADYKFAYGDAYNKYQWPTEVLNQRETAENPRPCLTVNKTLQHCLIVINESKQNKPGVRIRPVGDDASFEAAQIFQECIYHIEYISNAEATYDHATEYQVIAGIGYWRLVTEYRDTKSFEQEIYIRPIKDPRCVYLDRDIKEKDGSDARYGFVFDDVPKDLYRSKYPKFAFVGNQSVLGSYGDGWLSENHIRVAEYFRKTEKPDVLCTWLSSENGERILKLLSALTDTERLMYKKLRKDSDDVKASFEFKERKVLTDDVEWFRIAGDRIIERGKWAGKYIPIVRVPGIETFVDGIIDRKGHTRALINPQQIYNYNTSANVEYGALQTKSPWMASVRAVEGFEGYYKNANLSNYSWMPYNDIDDEGNEIKAPTRPAAPQASPAYVQQLQIAQNEMMMASGQYQTQFGENENAKSGVAINARQRQGDRATYHFPDNQAVAIRNTGKQLIDLIPKIYDTQRIMQIEAKDGTIYNVTIDPTSEKAFTKTNDVVDPTTGQQNVDIIFNPNIGNYDVMSDVGPSFATKRQEAFNALTQIAAQNKEFMNIAGDILWKVADFPEAQLLAQRWRKIIPKNVLGDAPDPQTEQAMHAAADKIEQQLGIIAKQAKDLADKTQALELKEREIALREKETAVAQQRLDYEAETKRLTALGNSGPSLTPDQIQPVVTQMIVGMLNAGEPGSGDKLRPMLEKIKIEPQPQPAPTPEPTPQPEPTEVQQ